MSGRPALASRYAVTLTDEHFPVGDEAYDFGVELATGEVVIASGVDVNATWAIDPPILDPDALTITGADDGSAAGSTATAWILVVEPGLEITVTAPDAP